jgi:hypothetical protein
MMLLKNDIIALDLKPSLKDKVGAPKDLTAKNNANPQIMRVKK